MPALPAHLAVFFNTQHADFLIIVKVTMIVAGWFALLTHFMNYCIASLFSRQCLCSGSKPNQ